MPKTSIAILLLAGLFALGAPARAADPEMKFETYKDKAGEFRWRLKAANGGVLATGGQGYKALADAKGGIELIKKAGGDEKMTFEVFLDESKEYRWRLKAGNAQTVAVSSEGYKAKADAEKAVESIKGKASKAEVVEAKD